jgi:hypothetical protein
MHGYVGSTRSIVVCEACDLGDDDFILAIASLDGVSRFSRMHAAREHGVFGEFTAVVNRDLGDWIIFVTSEVIQ